MIEHNGKKEKIYKAFDFIHNHIVVIIILFVIIASGASVLFIMSGDAKPESLKEKEINYEEMNILYFPLSRISSLNPLISNDADVYQINQLVYSSLFRLGNDLAPQKDLVKGYSVDSANGKVYITIKSNVYFSNGRKLTADDVIFTVETIQDIGETSAYYAYISKIDSMEKRSTYKLTVNFINPRDAALDNLVFPVVSKSDYAEEGLKNVGSGQYKYGKYSRESGLMLTANSKYYGEKAGNSVMFKFVPYRSKVTGLMTMDAITAYVDTNATADSLAGGKRLKIKNITSPELEMLGFNFKNKNLADKNVRQSIAYAINCQNLIDDNYGGNGVCSDSIYYPGFLGEKNGGDAYEEDLSKATKLLYKSEYLFDNSNQLKTKDGNPVVLRLIVNSEDSCRSDSATDIQEDLQQLGIKVIVKRLSRSQYFEALSAGDFDLYIGGYKFDKKYDLRRLFSAGNVNKYKNDELYNKIKDMEKSIETDDLKTLYGEVKNQLIDELPYYPICYKTYSFITVNKFKSPKKPMFFDFYRGCSGWSWERRIQNKVNR